MHLAQVSRSLATAAESSASVPLSEGVTEATVAALRPKYKNLVNKRSDDTVVQTGIILNRSPTLTRKPTAFERTYYAYQARIERALHNPVPTEFYFKPGSRATIGQRVRLNDAGQTNGELELFVEGKSIFTVKNLVFRDSDAGRIQGIQMQTFFGGSDSSYASPKDQSAYFSDFSVAITETF